MCRRTHIGCTGRWRKTGFCKYGGMQTSDYDRAVTNLTKALGYIKYARKLAERGGDPATASLLLAAKALREVEKLLPAIEEE